MEDRGTTNVNRADPPRRRSPILFLLAAALAAIVVALAVGVWRSEGPPVAAPSATPRATATPTGTATATSTATATPSAAATQVGTISGPCQNMSWQAPEQPIVPPRRPGQYLQVALDAVRPAPNGGNRWFVRFFVPEGAPGPAEIPLRATVTGPSGPLPTGAYEAGPPNAGSAPVTQPVMLQPCAQTAAPAAPFRGTVLIGVETAPVRSGSYTLTWSDIRLPEGGTRTETWTVTLTCELDPGPARPQSTVCK